MSQSTIQVYQDLLTFARAETMKVAEGVSPENQLFQVREGKSTPLWLVGHLANTMNTIMLRWMLDVPSVVPREQARLFAPDFAGGLPASSDASKYPPYNEVVQLYSTAMQHAIEGLAQMHDEQLDEPLKGQVPDQLRNFFSSNRASLRIIVNHDAYHRGQIGLLSKMRG